MIKISKRLETIASLIPINSKVIDVGCDHGLLDIYLYQNKIVNKIIASDVNENALNNAKKNVKKYNLNEYIETRLGNGLDTINQTDGINTIVMSGMGTHTVIDILKNNIDKLTNVETIIIQSNTKLELLREEIIKLNYYIADEKILEENKKKYIIIKFQKGNQKYTKKELYFGPILLKNNSELFRSINNLELLKLKEILQRLPYYKLIQRYSIKKKISLYK